MTKQTGIWIDGTKAIVISLEKGRESIHEIQAEIDNAVHHEQEGNKGSFMGSHHINNERTFDERKEHQINQFLDKVLDHIKKSDELFVMGPAEIKIKLKSKIEGSHLLAPKLRAVESSDHITLNQCVEKVKNFYQ